METIGPRFRCAVGIAWATALPVLVLLVYTLSLPEPPVSNHQEAYAAIRGPAAGIPCQPTSGSLLWALDWSPFGEVLASADASLVHFIRVTT